MALETRKGVLLVDPITQPVVASFTGAPRLKDPRVARVGLIDDSKPNARELLEELAGVLKDRYGVVDVMLHRKPSSSKPADPEVIADMGASCDYAVVAIGD